VIETSHDAIQFVGLPARQWRSVPPLAERREEVARRFPDTFIRKRLPPLGCLQAAIDETDSLLVARLPWLDADFGHAVETGEMAVAIPKESRPSAC
jgi:hypothetical protein